VNCIDYVKPNECFDFIDCTIRFKSAHCVYFTASHQPIQRGHRSAVFEERSIEQDDRFTIGRADNHTKLALWNATDEASDCLNVLC
jgi:hypothetical protein